MPAVLAVKMVLARGMDILSYRTFPADDGLLADLRWKKKMPVSVDLRFVRLIYSDAEIFKFAETDVLRLVRGVNRIFNLAGAQKPFVITRGIEGKIKNLKNFWVFRKKYQKKISFSKISMREKSVNFFRALLRKTRINYCRF